MTFTYFFSSFTLTFFSAVCFHVFLSGLPFTPFDPFNDLHLLFLLFDLDFLLGLLDLIVDLVELVVRVFPRVLEAQTKAHFLAAVRLDERKVKLRKSEKKNQGFILIRNINMYM